MSLRFNMLNTIVRIKMTPISIIFNISFIFNLYVHAVTIYYEKYNSQNIAIDDSNINKLTLFLYNTTQVILTIKIICFARKYDLTGYMPDY